MTPVAARCATSPRTSLRYAFAGTPDFAVPTLAALLEHFGPPVRVWTQPDRPAGRGRAATASPVKRLALARELALAQPERLDESAIQLLEGDAIDVFVVVAYGLLLPPRALAAARVACLNLHASLLPRWRGAAPIQRAIESGDPETGVCVMQMARGLDTGPVYGCASTPIRPDDTAQTLHDRLAELAASTLVEHLPAIVAGDCVARPQATEGVTYARKLDKNEAWLDWSQAADALERRVRAFTPWPGTQTAVASAPQDLARRLRIVAARALPEQDWPGQAAPPGSLIWSGRRTAPMVRCGRGVLELIELQWPGSRIMPAADALRNRLEWLLPNALLTSDTSSKAVVTTPRPDQAAASLQGHVPASEALSTPSASIPQTVEVLRLAPEHGHETGSDRRGELR